MLGLCGKIFALSYAGIDLFRHSQWKVIENEGQQFNLRLSPERVALQWNKAMSAKPYARINLRSEVTQHSCRYKRKKGLKRVKSRIRNSRPENRPDYSAVTDKVARDNKWVRHPWSTVYRTQGCVLQTAIENWCVAYKTSRIGFFKAVADYVQNIVLK